MINSSLNLKNSTFEIFNQKYNLTNNEKLIDVNLINYDSSSIMSIVYNSKAN